MFARWEGSFWDIQTVDVLDWFGPATSLAFDHEGNPVIAYSESIELDDYPFPRQDDLKVARYDGHWITESFSPLGESPPTVRTPGFSGVASVGIPSLLPSPGRTRWHSS
jgi:hypothetical protein